MTYSENYELAITYEFYISNNSEDMSFSAPYPITTPYNETCFWQFNSNFLRLSGKIKFIYLVYLYPPVPGGDKPLLKTHPSIIIAKKPSEMVWSTWYTTSGLSPILPLLSEAASLTGSPLRHWKEKEFVTPAHYEAIRPDGMGRSHSHIKQGGLVCI